MRSGLKIIAITSVVMAVLTAWQAIPSKGWKGSSGDCFLAP